MPSTTLQHAELQTYIHKVRAAFTAPTHLPAHLQHNIALGMFLSFAEILLDRANDPNLGASSQATFRSALNTQLNELVSEIGRISGFALSNPKKYDPLSQTASYLIDQTSVIKWLATTATPEDILRIHTLSAEVH